MGLCMEPGVQAQEHRRPFTCSQDVCPVWFHEAKLPSPSRQRQTTLRIPGEFRVSGRSGALSCLEQRDSPCHSRARQVERVAPGFHTVFSGVQIHSHQRDVQVALCRAAFPDLRALPGVTRTYTQNPGAGANVQPARLEPGGGG